MALSTRSTVPTIFIISESAPAGILKPATFFITGSTAPMALVMVPTILSMAAMRSFRELKAAAVSSLAVMTTRASSPAMVVSFRGTGSAPGP